LRQTNHRRMELYQQGLNDCEIARVEGKTRHCITNWRKRYNLPPNALRGRPKAKPKDSTTLKMALEKALDEKGRNVIRNFFYILAISERKFPDMPPGELVAAVISGLHRVAAIETGRTDFNKLQRQRRRRQKLLLNGLCVTCGKRPIAQGRSERQCETCLEHAKERNRANYYKKKEALKQT
jgi:hypothetical protein